MRVNRYRLIQRANNLQESKHFCTRMKISRIFLPLLKHAVSIWMNGWKHCGWLQPPQPPPLESTLFISQRVVIIIINWVVLEVGPTKMRIQESWIVWYRIINCLHDPFSNWISLFYSRNWNHFCLITVLFSLKSLAQESEYVLPANSVWAHL